MLYGRQWQAAVLPFQVLCAGGMLKLLNNYGSQANEAVGAIWRQASRQAVGTVLVVIGAAVGSFHWGIFGAALGVTIAMGILTVSMQELVRRATGSSWRALLVPQVPAVTCTALIVGVLWATTRLLDRMAPHAAAWQQLAVLVGVGAVAYGAFLLFSPFASLRELVHETVEELFPASAGRVLGRLGFRGPSRA